MHERKQKMANLSDGIIALPGGCGTLEELLEIITWKQLGLYLNPIIILNTNRFFDPLLEMLEKAIDENFMRRQHGDIWKVAQTPEEAVQLLYETPVWLSLIHICNLYFDDEDHNNKNWAQVWLGPQNQYEPHGTYYGVQLDRNTRYHVCLNTDKTNFTKLVRSAI